MNKDSINFLRGFFYCYCCFMMHQDYLGLRRYVELLHERWVEIPFLLWLLPMTLIIMWRPKDKS